MSSYRFWQKTCLLLLALLAPIAMHRLANVNGLFEHMPRYNIVGAVLPGTNVAVRVPKTGITIVDEYLSFMVSLFWIDLDSRNVKAHVQGTHFYGTLSSVWLLMLVEAHRSGQNTWFLYGTYIIEIFGELFGLGFFTPLWCLFQLATSSVEPLSKQKGPQERLYIEAGDSRALSLAFFLGFGIPSAMMFGTQPGHAATWSTQTWILLRLVHPLFVWAFWALLNSRATSSVTQTKIKDGIDWSRVRVLQRFYTWSMLLSAFGHLLSLAPLIQSVMEPGWLVPEVFQQISPREIFSITAFWVHHPTKILNFAQGVSIFLQWDEILTAVSIVVWAVGTYLHTRTETSPKSSTWAVLLNSIGFGIIGGPGAAAAFLLQERDSLIFDYSSGSDASSPSSAGLKKRV